MKLESSTELPAKLLGGIAACVVVVFVGLGFTATWRTLELKGFDALTTATAPGSSSLPITIVGIDEASFGQIGRQWPWPRGLYGKLVDQLSKSGALVIGIDVLMPEASTPGEDDAFAKAIAHAGNVVLVSDMAYQESAYARQWIRVDPLPQFTAAGARAGFAIVNLDPDLEVRKLPQGGDVFWREIVKRANERQPGLLAIAEPDPDAMIRYVGPDHTFPYVSFYQALEADKLLPPDAFRDQVVLIGRDLKASPEAGAAQADLFATPFLAQTGWLTPGVEIHANVLETAIAGASIKPAPAWWNGVLVLLAVTVCTAAMRRWRPLPGALVMLFVVGAIVAADWQLFVRARTWLPVFAAVGSAISIYLAFGGAAFLTERRRKGEIRRAFALYVSPEVVDHVMANPEGLKLGGERREVTMFFSDLKDFTPMTERLGAEQVARVLNQHFTRATAIIKRHNGTVNRFIGDAIMAMWGAPLEDARQAAHALAAAVEVQEDLKALRHELAFQGLPEIYMRIGIHTCIAVIGNLGSSDRFDYTAIGDGVNLAARLEGVNKLYGTGILVSGETVAKAGGAVPVRRVDRVIVKGKSEPVDIFTPCADAALNETSERAFDASCARRWQEAEGLWSELLARNPGDRIAAMQLERVRELRRAAPSPEWNGAIELEKL